jgi:hypothetical protein
LPTAACDLRCSSSSATSRATTRPRWYWEAAIALRKAASSLAVTVLYAYPVNQVYAYIVVITLYLFGHVVANPVASPWLLLLERVSCAAAVATASVLLVGSGFGNPALSSGWASALIILLIAGVATLLYALVCDTINNSPLLVAAARTLRHRSHRAQTQLTEQELEDALQAADTLGACDATENINTAE